MPRVTRIIGAPLHIAGSDFRPWPPPHSTLSSIFTASYLFLIFLIDQILVTELEEYIHYSSILGNVYLASDSFLKS